MRIASPPIAIDPTNPPAAADQARIEKVARDFEAQFAQMLIKSMRYASFGDSMFPGENQLYRQMYDQQIAGQLTQGRGLGLAPMIARQLGGKAAAGSEAGPAKPSAFSLERRAAGYSLAGYSPSGAARTPAKPASAPDAAPSDAASSMERLAATSQPELRPGSFSASARLAMAQLRELEAAVSGNNPSLSSAMPAFAFDQGATAPPTDFQYDKPIAADSKSPESFVASIWPQAKRAAAELGIDPKVLIAQAALETGWGKHQIRTPGAGGGANNLFGIKAGGSWRGESVRNLTTENVNGAERSELADFRAYASPAESFADYVRLLKTQPRYRDALAAGGDGRRYAAALQKAGYATDPAYAAKITAIAEGPTLGRAMAAISRRENAVAALAIADNPRG